MQRTIDGRHAGVARADEAQQARRQRPCGEYPPRQVRHYTQAVASVRLPMQRPHAPQWLAQAATLPGREAQLLKLTATWSAVCYPHLAPVA